MNLILDKLITMTIDEVEMYPSIQAKIWGNIGVVSDLLDMVLDSFIKVREKQGKMCVTRKEAHDLVVVCVVLLQRSVTGGLGSVQAEIMADTAVALASANVQLVSRKVIVRLCKVRSAAPVSLLQYITRL